MKQHCTLFSVCVSNHPRVLPTMAKLYIDHSEAGQTLYDIVDCLILCHLKLHDEMAWGQSLRMTFSHCTVRCADGTWLHVQICSDTHFRKLASTGFNVISFPRQPVTSKLAHTLWSKWAQDSASTVRFLHEERQGLQTGLIFWPAHYAIESSLWCGQWTFGYLGWESRSHQIQFDTPHKPNCTATS